MATSDRGGNDMQGFGNLAIVGSRMTCPGTRYELTEKGLDAAARRVAHKNPHRRYYIVDDRRNKLYRWHVGQGFSHAEGWWVGA